MRKTSDGRSRASGCWAMAAGVGQIVVERIVCVVVEKVLFRASVP